MELWRFAAVMAMPVGTFVWCIYDYRIAPLMISAAEIEAKARTLVERYGERAAEVVLNEARHDLLYCDLRRAGRARRVAQACADLPYCNHEAKKSI